MIFIKVINFCYFKALQERSKRLRSALFDILRGTQRPNIRDQTFTTNQLEVIAWFNQVLEFRWNTYIFILGPDKEAASTS